MFQTVHGHNPDICKMILDQTKTIPVDRSKDSQAGLLHDLASNHQVLLDKDFVDFLEYMCNLVSTVSY